MSEKVVYLLSREQREYSTFLRFALARKSADSVYYRDAVDGLLYIGDLNKGIDEYEKYLIGMRIRRLTYAVLTWPIWSEENLRIEPKEMAS